MISFHWYNCPFLAWLAAILNTQSTSAQRKYNKVIRNYADFILLGIQN